jgi:hypothetical protein
MIIFFGAIIVVAVCAVMLRYQVVQGTDGYRGFDRWTGKTMIIYRDVLEKEKEKLEAEKAVLSSEKTKMNVVLSLKMREIENLCSLTGRIEVVTNFVKETTYITNNVYVGYEERNRAIANYNILSQALNEQKGQTVKINGIYYPRYRIVESVDGWGKIAGINP